MKNIKLGKLAKLSALAAFLLTSAASLFADPIDITTLTKDDSGRYTYTFTKENWNGTGKINEEVSTTSFTYSGDADVTLYLDAMCSNWTDGRGRYQGSITQTGTGKINVVWKTDALRMGAPSVTTNYTGTTTFERGSSLYLYDGTELGQGKLILNGGNICSGWNSAGTGTVAANDIVFNDIELKNHTTFRAGWGSSSYNPPASLTFNGVVSGSKTLTFGGESNPGPVTINGTNTYTGGTTFAYNVYSQGDTTDKTTGKVTTTYSTVSSNGAHIMYDGTAYAMRGALTTLNSNQPFGDVTKTVTIKNAPESFGTSTASVGTPLLWAFKTTDSSSAKVDRAFANPINLEQYEYKSGKIVYSDSTKTTILEDTHKTVTTQSHLYLLNDGAVSGSTYGTVTITSKLTGAEGSVLHILNKGFTLNPAELGNVTVAVSSGDNPFGTEALSVTGNGGYTFQTPTDTEVTSVAHTVAHSSITISNDTVKAAKTFTISNTDTTKLSVTPTTVTFNYASKLKLTNTSAANAITFGSSASPVTLVNNGTLDLSSSVGAKAYIASSANSSFNVVGATSATNKASIYYETSKDHTYTGALTGYMDLTISKGTVAQGQSANVRFNHNYGTGDRLTGNVYLNNQNIYLTYTDDLGTATAGTAIYYNLTGNMSNGGNSTQSRPVVNKDIILQRNGNVRVGWMPSNETAITNPCSITFNGTISEQGGSRSLTLGSNNEPSSGRFIINGNNTYSGGTLLGTTNNLPGDNASRRYHIRSEYILGSSTALGTGNVSAFSTKEATNGCIPFAIKLNTTDKNNPVTFSNKLDIKNNVVSLNNFSENTVIYAGEIVGTAGTTLYFGEFDYTQVYTCYNEGNDKASYDWSSFNKGKGLILFNGTIGTETANLNTQVNDGVKLGGTGQFFGNVDLVNGSLVTLSTEMNDGHPMTVNGTMTLEEGSTLELNVSASEMNAILSLDDLVQNDGATIKLNFTGTLTDENQIPIIASAKDLSNLKFTMNGVDAAVVYRDGQMILATHSSVPEPSTLILLLGLIGFGGGLKWKVFGRR